MKVLSVLAKIEEMRGRGTRNCRKDVENILAVFMDGQM